MENSVTRPALFEMFSARLDWLSRRQTVLTRNIANADTPRYRPMDVVEPDFRALVERVPQPGAVAVARTDPRHLQGSVRASAELDARRQRRPWEEAPAGNAVVLDEQMGKLAETNLQQQLTVNLRRSFSQMRKIALGVGQGG